MKATATNGDEWTGERSGELWIYRDKEGWFYESREVPAYRIRSLASGCDRPADVAGTPTMKPTLEPAGPLQVPVDETGTATGRPEPAPDDMRTVLRNLVAEASHFVNTGQGEQYLRNALWDARRVLEGGAL